MIDKNDFRYRVRLVEYARKHGIEHAALTSGYTERDVRLMMELYESGGAESLKGLLRLEGKGVAEPVYNISERLHQTLPQFYAELVRDILRSVAGGPKSLYSGIWGALVVFIRHAIFRQRRPFKYIIPSVALHLLLLSGLSMLANVDISTVKPEQEFTFVEMATEQPVYVPEFPDPESGGELETPGAKSEPRQRPVKTSAPERTSQSAQGVEDLPETETTERKGAAGSKEMAGLEAANGSPLEAEGLEGRIEGGEKSIDVTQSRTGPKSVEAKLSPRDLKMEAGGGTSRTKSGPQTKTIGEKSGTAAKASEAGGGQQTPSEKGGGLAGGKKAATLEAGAAPGDGGRVGLPELGATGKKTGELSAARPGTSDGITVGDVRTRAPGKLDISASGQKAGGAATAGGRQAGTIEKSGGVASAGGEAARSSRAGAEGAGPIAGTRRTTELGIAAGGSRGGEAAPDFRAAAGRSAGLESPERGRTFTPSGGVPAPRKLDIQSGGQSGGKGQPGRPGGKGTQGPAGIGEKSASRAGAGAGAEYPGGGSGGYSGSRGSGKGVETGALSGGGGTGATPGLSAGGEKVAKLGGRQTRGGGTAVPEAKPSRGGGLGGLFRDTMNALLGTGDGKGKGGEGGGVQLGSASKGGTAAPTGAGPGAAGLGGGDVSLPGEKAKTPGSALGVPGGTGKDKFASAGRTKSGQLAPEKVSGVGTGKQGLRSFGPTVKIISPGPGDTKEITQVVSGMVSDLRAKKATLTVNGDSRVISVVGGRFEAVVALKQGKNMITVMAFDPEGNVGKDQVALNYSTPQGRFAVDIAEPRNGQVFDVSHGNTVKVRGTVADPKVKSARMILNGSPKEIVVRNGSFSQDVALTQEQNSVVVEAQGSDGSVSSSRQVSFATVNVSPKDIMIVLTWDKPKADFDLHVYDPQGGHTSYKSPNIYESREAIVGGQLEQDAKGNYGPEVFTQESAAKGAYTVKSNYYYSGGDGDAHATVTVILYGDNPARRIVRVFGPHIQKDTQTGEEVWDVARFKMPEGIFLEE